MHATFTRLNLPLKAYQLAALTASSKTLSIPLKRSVHCCKAIYCFSESVI